jgi:hypothetical protein
VRKKNKPRDKRTDRKTGKNEGKGDKQSENLDYKPKKIAVSINTKYI